MLLLMIAVGLPWAPPACDVISFTMVAPCGRDPPLVCNRINRINPLITNELPRGKTNNVVSEQSDTNRPVQLQKQARSLKFWS